MAKNRAHEEVTESDSSSGTCVKFRFYEEQEENGDEGEESKKRERGSGGPLYRVRKDC